jgi:phosphinothricin acetyltransferase
MRLEWFKGHNHKEYPIYVAEIDNVVIGFEYMESKCDILGIKTLFAVIIDNNEASINLIEKCGYKKWGHLPKIAIFDNIEVGHLYYGKRILP